MSIGKNYNWNDEEIAFICDLESRHMSDWTEEEMNKYNELTGQPREVEE